MNQKVSDFDITYIDPSSNRIVKKLHDEITALKDEKDELLQRIKELERSTLGKIHNVGSIKRTRQSVSTDFKANENSDQNLNNRITEFEKYPTPKIYFDLNCPPLPHDPLSLQSDIRYQRLIKPPSPPKHTAPLRHFRPVGTNLSSFAHTLAFNGPLENSSNFANGTYLSRVPSCCSTTLCDTKSETKVKAKIMKLKASVNSGFSMPKH